MHKTTNNSKRKFALLAGISLIIMAIVAGFAYGYIFQSVYISGDAVKTLANLKNSLFLFRIFIFLFLVVLILDIIVSWAFYFFFVRDNKMLSLLSSWIRLVYSALLGISFLSLLNVLQLLKLPAQDSELILLCLDSFLDMWSLGLIVFGSHLLILGYLIFTSGYIPKFIGVLTLLASISYISSNTANLLLDNYTLYKPLVDTVLSLPMAAGELGIAIWLIVKGGKIK
jgi:hypothetical protein